MMQRNIHIQEINRKEELHLPFGQYRCKPVGRPQNQDENLKSDVEAAIGLICFTLALPHYRISVPYLTNQQHKLQVYSGITLPALKLVLRSSRHGLISVECSDRPDGSLKALRYPQYPVYLGEIPRAL